LPRRAIIHFSLICIYTAGAEGLEIFCGRTLLRRAAVQINRINANESGDDMQMEFKLHDASLCAHSALLIDTAAVFIFVERYELVSCYCTLFINSATLGWDFFFINLQNAKVKRINQ
jgi:hypothetical protein